MRVSAFRTPLKPARDNVLLPSALAGGRAWRRMRLRPGRWPGLMLTAIDIQSGLQGAIAATWSHQVQPRPAARDAHGVVYLGPPAQTPVLLLSVSNTDTLRE